MKYIRFIPGLFLLAFYPLNIFYYQWAEGYHTYSPYGMLAYFSNGMLTAIFLFWAGSRWENANGQR